MNRTLLLSLSTLVVLGLGLGTGYWLAQPGAHKQALPGSAVADAPATDARKPLYWHDPMYPQQKFDKPGKSPFMDMMLVPVYADDGSDGPGVRISARVAQNLGVRTAQAFMGVLDQKVEAVGAVAFDERAMAIVPARVTGFIERLFVRAPLDPVTRGQPLAEILAPEWVAAQEEYLALRRSPEAGEPLRLAARQRLMLLGVPEASILALEADGKVRPRVTLTAPMSGVVVELGAREGMAVTAGATLFRINGMGTVWVNADVAESQSALVHAGSEASASVPAYPGEVFKARVATLLPEVSATTRTLKARIEIANPKGRLKPGMYATIDLAPGSRRETLLVPSEAVIRTGQRAVIVVAEPGEKGARHFRPVDVELGAEAGGRTEVRQGLEAGMQVVLSGQFLIDSEASLKGTASRLAGASASHQGTGKVESIGQGQVTLTHGPIPSLQWGEMTMEFMAPPGVLPAGLKPGAQVSFAFQQNAKGEYELTSLSPLRERGSAP